MHGSPNDRARTWRSPHLAGTQFLRADFRRQRFDRHFHDEFAIGVIDSGCQAFAYDQGRRLDMHGGQVALIAPGIVHAGWPGAEEGWRYRMLYPAADLVRQAVSDVFGSNAAMATFHRPVVDDPRLRDLLMRLHAASEPPDADAMQVEALFLVALREAFERHAGLRLPPAPRRHQAAVTVVRDLIEARHAEALTLQELGRSVGLSRFQLLRQFKATFGLPPHAYLRQVRVRRARAAILAGDALAEAAGTAGFADQAHMTRAFRATLGYTPGALARGRP